MWPFEGKKEDKQVLLFKQVYDRDPKDDLGIPYTWNRWMYLGIIVGLTYLAVKFLFFGGRW